MTPFVPRAPPVALLPQVSFSATAKAYPVQETAANPQMQTDELTEPIIETEALEAEADEPPNLPISEASDVPLDEEKAEVSELENGQGVEDTDYR